MSTVDLLPHRQAERLRRQQRWQRCVLLGVLAGSVFAALLFFHLRSDIADLHAQLDLAQSQQAQARRVEQARRQEEDALQGLQSRLAALVEQQAMQTAPMGVLTEVARAMPLGMTLRELRIEDSVVPHAGVLIEGHAMDAATVTEFVNTLAASVRRLQSPELVEIGPIQIELAGARTRVEAFSVRARLARGVP